LKALSDEREAISRPNGGQGLVTDSLPKPRKGHQVNVVIALNWADHEIAVMIYIEGRVAGHQLNAQTLLRWPV
jgi:hypothetical protein